MMLIRRRQDSRAVVHYTGEQRARARTADPLGGKRAGRTGGREVELNDTVAHLLESWLPDALRAIAAMLADRGADNWTALPHPAPLTRLAVRLQGRALDLELTWPTLTLMTSGPRLLVIAEGELPNIITQAVVGRRLDEVVDIADTGASNRAREIGGAESPAGSNTTYLEVDGRLVTLTL